MTLEAVRHHTTNALLAGLVVGAGVAATILALTPSSHPQPPAYVYTTQDKQALTALLLPTGAPQTPAPTNWQDALTSLLVTHPSP